ncbi:peptidase M4 thermolysin [Lanmaoa asiatica]|nr:peptidase M4 thermolysin [Lanmaoa asiatica]
MSSRSYARHSLEQSITLAQNRTASIKKPRAMGGGPGVARSIIPGYIMSAIANSNQVSDHTRDAALRTLHTSQAIRVERNQHAANLRTAQRGAARPKRLNRVVYDSQNSEVKDSRLGRSEGGAESADVAVNECYDGFGATFNLFRDVFDRNSIDDLGTSIIGSVHYRQNFMNAFWIDDQMLFGDGDGVFFNRFTASLDVIGHGLTHGITQHTANLNYEGESGALNESMSDVFGSMVKQYRLNQTAAQADWLIGAEIFTDRVHGVALRSMSAPGTAYDDSVFGKDPQTASYDQVLANPYANDYDNGGVHIYSGVPNRAFYLAAIALGGNSWDRVGRVWYATLTGGGLNPAATFMDFAKLTCQNAEALFDANVRAVVAQAWIDVGVDVNGNNEE